MALGASRRRLGLALPPQPILMCWGTWLNLTKGISDHPICNKVKYELNCCLHVVLMWPNTL